MSAYRDAYFKFLCQAVAEWVGKREDVEAVEVSKHGLGAFNSAERGENSRNSEIVKVRFNLFGQTRVAAFVAGSGDQPGDDEKDIVPDDMRAMAMSYIKRAEAAAEFMIQRLKPPTMLYSEADGTLAPAFGSDGQTADEAKSKWTPGGSGYTSKPTIDFHPKPEN